MVHEKSTLGDASPLLETGEPEENQVEILLPEKKATIGSSYINLTNTILGAGMLGMPFAFSAAGMPFGGMLLIICAFLAAFGLHLLAECARELEATSKEPIVPSYFQVAKTTYPKARLLIDGAIAIKCFGVSISYLIVIGDLMPQATESLFHPHSDSFLLNRHFWITVFMGLVIPISFLKRLDSLRFTSIVALFSVVYLLIIVIYYFFDPHTSHASSDNLSYAPSLSILPNLPIFVFAFTCHQNIFSIYNELPNAAGKRINRVIGLSASTCFIVYAAIGYCGYLTFGDDVSSNIISDYKNRGAFVTIGKIAITILVTFSYPLQCHPARNSIDKILFAETKQSLPRFIIETSALLIGSYIIAFFVSNLGIVFSIVGATGSTTICYILPGCFYYKLKERTPYLPKRIASLCLAILGVCVMIMALTFTFLEEFHVIDAKVGGGQLGKKASSNSCPLTLQ